MGRASPALASFNAGEISKRLEGRTDTDKYAAGCKVLEGFISLIQGPATRRGGFKFAGEVKDSSKRTWLVPFEFNTTQAFVLEFGDGYIRFYANHAQVITSGVAAYNGATAYAPGNLVTSGGVTYYCIANTTGNAPPNATYWYAQTGVIYEIPSPYSVADMLSADGTCNLRIIQSADVLYICHPSYQTRKLTRFGSTNWVVSLLNPTGGPFKTLNSSTTNVYASAQTGSVTLVANGSIFTAAMVGSLFYLEERSTTSAKPWQSATAYSIGDRVRHDGKNYVAATAGTSGSDAPVHTSGTVYDGATVSWTYEDPGYGYGQITGYTSPTQVTMLVIKPLPFLSVLVGNASTNWAFGAWSSIEGWPTHVAFFRERLCFGRGIEVWLSVSGDFENFDTRDASGLVVTDSSFKRTLTAQKINNILWMEVFSPTSEALMIGTAGAEFAIKSQTESQPFGVDNVSAQPVSTIGSRNVVPVHVGQAILFAQRSGKKLQDLTYDYYSGNNGSNDQTLYADHMLLRQSMQMAYQQEPFSIIWTVRSDFKLVGMTYSREQYPSAPHGGWHRHPVAADCECICTIPNDTTNELWAEFVLTVNGATKRYIAYKMPEDGLEDDQEDAFFVDLGSTYDGSVATTLTPGAGANVKNTTGVPFAAGAASWVAGDVGRYIYRRYSYIKLDSSGQPYTAYATAKALITGYTDSTHVTATIQAAFPDLSVIASGGWRMTVTTISGLGYLEGKEVDILIDGATHPKRTVTAGAISLQSPASKIHIGLPMPARLQIMRLNAGAQDGTSQGKKGYIPNVAIRLLRTLGLRFGQSFAKMDVISFRTPANLMDNAPPLFTGDIDKSFPGGINSDPWLCFEQSDPLPCTIVGLYPQSIVSDKA